MDDELVVGVQQVTLVFPHNANAKSIALPRLSQRQKALSYHFSPAHYLSISYNRVPRLDEIMRAGNIRVMSARISAAV